MGLTGIATSGATPLSLADAFNQAENANFELLIAQQQVISAEEQVTVASSVFLPTVDFTASQSRISTLNQFAGGGTNTFNRFEALVRAELSLLDFSSRNTVRSARAGLDATRKAVEATVQTILQGIGNAYLSYWRNLRRLDVIEANLERDRALLEIAQNQEAAGVATPLDVTRAEVRLSANELARLQQETLVLDSSLTLKRLLNIPLGTEIQLVDVIFPEEKAPMDQLMRLLSMARSGRPDLMAAKAEMEAAEFSVSSAKSSRLPDLAISGQYGFTDEEPSSDMDEQWSVGIGVTVPIFEGNRIASNTRTAEVQLRQAELNLANLEQQVEAEVRFSLQNLDSRFNQLKVAREQVNLSQREFELARIRFEEGVADNADVVSAQAALADAEDTLVEAEFQYALSRIQLARVIGDVRWIFRPNLLQ